MRMKALGAKPSGVGRFGFAVCERQAQAQHQASPRPLRPARSCPERPFADGERPGRRIGSDVVEDHCQASLLFDCAACFDRFANADIVPQRQMLPDIASSDIGIGWMWVAPSSAEAT